MSQIICQDLSIGYEGKTILQDINFTVEKGDYVCIVGENGAGKSTLMRTLLHLQPPTGGRIVLGDGLRENEMGYLPQQTPTQRDFPATVTEVVLSGFSNRRARFFYTAEEKSAALMNLGKLGVLELKDKCYRELSGGQQQRVLLARALCAANDLLILDEPVTGLDPASMQDLYKTLRYLNEREGMAIIMVTHDIENALREAKHILCVDRAGCFYGTVDEFLSSPAGKRFGGERA